MIQLMSEREPLSVKTRILSLAEHGFPRFGMQTARKLAASLVQVSRTTDASSVTIEDLLFYLPTRYEDRSSMVEIRHLYHGLEASLDLTVRGSGGFPVRNRRSFRPQLYKFEVSAIDQQRTGRPVVVWWFISGARARQIIDYYAKRLVPGARFVAFGTWEWDSQRGTYSLKLHKPDELEMVALADEEDSDSETDAALAAIHVGRCVPVYRKLGDFRSKRLREMMHQLLARLSTGSIEETLPADLRARQKLVSRDIALRHIHFPAGDAPLDDYHNALIPAHRRLIFEVFFFPTLRSSS